MPRKKNRLRQIVGGALLVFMAILIAWPAIEFFVRSSAYSRPSVAFERLERLAMLRTWLMNLFGIGWFFCVGAVIGSFLNVVVWRLPRGASVVDKPSSCPFCCTKINALDNVPVIGWINLEGRCRACRLPISSRYPLVEATMGLIFVILLFAELLSGGANLPGVPLTTARGFTGVVFEARWSILRVYAYHAALFCWLAPWALIAWDRQRIPKSTFAVAALVGLGAPLIWPGLHPLAALDAGLPPRWAELATGLIGALVGLGLGLGVRWCEQRMEEDRSRGWALPTMLCMIGLFLGWQAVLTITAIAMPPYAIIYFVRLRQGKLLRRGCAEGALVAAALAAICLWNDWADLVWLPGEAFSAVGLCVVLPAYVLSVALIAGGRRLPHVDKRRFQLVEAVSPPRTEPIEFNT